MKLYSYFVVGKQGTSNTTLFVEIVSTWTEIIILLLIRRCVKTFVQLLIHALAMPIMHKRLNERFFHGIYKTAANNPP